MVKDSRFYRVDYCVWWVRVLIASPPDIDRSDGLDYRLNRMTWLVPVYEIVLYSELKMHDTYLLFVIRYFSLYMVYSLNNKVSH